MAIEVTDMTIRMRGITSILFFAAVFVAAAAGLFAPIASAAPSDRGTCLQGSGKEAVAACKRALDTTPGDLKLLLKLGDRLQESGDFHEAAAVLQKAAKRFPENKTVNRKLEMVESLLKEQEWLEKRKAKKTDKIAGANQKTRMRLNRIRCTSLKGSKGLAACDEALATVSDDPVLHYARGDILLQMGRIDAAKEAYVQALKLDPDNPEYSQKLAALGGMLSGTTAAGPQTQTGNADGSGDSPSASQATRSYIFKRMALLKSLVDQGLIDEEEYDRRKTNLLDTTLQAAREPTGKPNVKVPASIDLGDYHALVIGIQNYRHLTKLETVRQDTVAVADVLQKRYGFKVQRLYDATRRQILLALGEYRRKLGKNDNLLIYYAGHGWLDKDADAGYWLPVDAASDNDVDWLSLNAVTSGVRAIPAKHVMIVADSCYSGKLTRGIHIKRKTSDYVSRMAKKRTRVVLSSGGLEPVLDSGGANGHSVFAAAFLNILQKNQEVMDGTTLFSRIRQPVMLNAAQTPEYSDIRKAGNGRGEFLFVPRK
jgi:tetratricopeptide (TPR) repeat protein